jgi:hypothetical protein
VHGKEGLVEILMIRVERSGCTHFHHRRKDASIFLKICSCCIKSKLLAEENGMKMRIWRGILGWGMRFQSLGVDGSPVGRKNRATSKHGFSGELENFPH